MKKQGYAILMAFILIFALTGCGNKSLLSAKEPVELTMWHVYGEQAGSPMDTLVEEFNRTEGKEKGVRVKVTELSSAAKIGGFLLETQGDSAQEMPDLFTCHIGDAIALARTSCWTGMTGSRSRNRASLCPASLRTVKQMTVNCWCSPCPNPRSCSCSTARALPAFPPPPA